MGAIWNGIKAVLGHTLAFFYAIIPDYGIAIILLTVAVSLLLFPLTLKQTRSMRAMQEIQPEVKKLQKELKSDREELNKQLMELYKERGVNPAAGCLPLLAQMPIWFALFQVLRLSVVTAAVVGAVAVPGADPSPDGLQPGDEIVAIDGNAVEWWRTVEDGFVDGEPHDVTIRRAGAERTLTVETLEGITPTGEKFLDPDNVVPKSSQLEAGLKSGDTKFLSMDLLVAPSRAAEDGISNAIPYILLIVVVMITGYYQQWQTTRRRDPQDTQNPQQQSMQTVMKIMPLFLGFISWSFPTGLVLYFAASAIFRIGQQAVILRLDEEKEDGGPAAKSKEDEPPQDEGPVGRSKGPSPHASKKRKKRRRK